LESEKQSDQESNSDNHHPYPKFRIPKRYKGSKNSLIGKWAMIKTPSRKAHRALHFIFGDRFPEDQLKFLKRLCNAEGFLDARIYGDYKELFDVIFGGDKSLAAMKETLKKWDLSEEIKKKHSNRIALILSVSKSKASGGIPIRKYKLN